MDNMNADNKRVDIVFIDDDEILAEVVVIYFERKSLKVDTYNSPSGFLANQHKYTKDTKICMCHDFDENEMNGIELAGLLNKDGYKRLYLFTGYWDLVVPNYLTVMLKGVPDDVLSILAAS